MVDDVVKKNNQPVVQPCDAFLCFVTQRSLGQPDASTLAEGLKLFKLPPVEHSWSSANWSALKGFVDDHWYRVPAIDLEVLAKQRKLKNVEEKRQTLQESGGQEESKTRKTELADLQEPIKEQQDVFAKLPDQQDLILQNCLVIDDKLLDLLFTRSLTTRQFSAVHSPE